MSRRLLIVGAGGFGREVWAWVRDIARAQNNWPEIGFLDKNPDALQRCSRYGNIVGDPDSYVPLPTDIFVAGIGDGQTRLRACRDLQRRGAAFIQIIHPTAIVGPGVRLGVGTILCPYSVITADALVGDFVLMNAHSSVGHDAVIGDGCTLSGHCDVTGQARLGKCVFMGTHAAVLPGARVGDFANIGAGSVVLRHVPEHATVIGVPAKNLWQSSPTQSRPAA